MREIKYRQPIWKDGKIIQWHVWGFKNGLYQHPINQHESYQYTGLKDKNGKEIYEGDIIRKEECSPDDPAFGHYGSVGVVKYVPDVMGFIIDTADTGDDGFYDGMKMNFSFNEIEVIGNVHETPELIL